MTGRVRTMALVTAMLFGLAAPTLVAGQTVKRPIQDFIAGQTSTTSWTEPETGNGIFVDYANKVNAGFLLGLPTSFTGTITERPLPDGRARVKVSLHTKNAYTTASLGGVGFVFGSTVAEIIGGADAGLSDSLLTVDFINTAPGAPLPNLVNLIFLPAPGQEIMKVSFVSSGKGPLRPLFGAPPGTLGMASTTQRGLYDVPGQGQGLDNDFPAEHIEVKAIGKKK